MTPLEKSAVCTYHYLTEKLRELCSNAGAAVTFKARVCRGIPGCGLAGAAEGASESLGVIPRSLCLNISLGFTAR